MDGRPVIVKTCVDPFSSGYQPLAGDQRGLAHGSVSSPRQSRKDAASSLHDRVVEGICSWPPSKHTCVKR